MITVYPDGARYDALLTLLTPAAHGDPRKSDGSNVKPFNRQLQLVHWAGDASTAGEAEIGRIVASNLVPTELKDVVQRLRFDQFVAICLMRTFVDAYNSTDGVGLFSKEKRYEYLATRCAVAAGASQDLQRFWDLLCDELQVPIHYEATDAGLLTLLNVPVGTQRQVLEDLLADTHSVVTIARYWSRLRKEADPEYAKAAKTEPLITDWHELTFTEEPGMADAGYRDRVPCFSGNSARHSMVRQPGTIDLFNRLGLLPSEPGRGPLPPTVVAAFWNGREVVKGEEAPSSAFALRNEIAERYPLAGLVGGCFVPAEICPGVLQVHTWLVCRENKSAIPYSLPHSNVSAHEMISDHTITRQASPDGIGQMITSFGTLAPGAQLYVRFGLEPGASRLQAGALMAATAYWAEHSPYIGGQSARGYGLCKMEWQGDDADERTALYTEYHDYLADNADELAAGLLDGTFGTKRALLA
jgi:hypothetical protein